MNTKGILFTIDGFMALVIATTMIIGSINYLSETSVVSSPMQNINRISMDALAILEKNETLTYAVDSGNIAQVQNFLNSLPAQYCGNISIYNSASVIQSSAQKTDCGDHTESSFARRVFLANNKNVYYAEMEAWFRVE